MKQNTEYLKRLRTVCQESLLYQDNSTYRVLPLIQDTTNGKIKVCKEAEIK